MAPNNTQRLSVGGDTYGGEVWECTLWFKPTVIGDTVPDNNGDAATTLDNMTTGTEWDTLAGALVRFLPTSGGINKAKLYCYPGGGSAAAAIAEKTLTVAGTGTGGTTPLQTSLVATLLTGQAGRSYRGRIYVPAPNISISSDHQVSLSDITAVANGVAQYLSWTKLAAILPSGNGLLGVVASEKRLAATSITQVRVDSKPDVQRRRAAKLAAARQYLADVTL